MVHKLENPDLVLPRRMGELILGGTCVAFIGSGPSLDTYDSWCVLVNNLCKTCGSHVRVTEDSTSDAYLDAAQNAKNCNKAAYYAYLGTHFGNIRGRTDLLYSVLLALNFRCYLTLNFDGLLAEHARIAYPKCKCPPKVYPSLDRLDMMNRSIHYLHGLITEGQAPQEGTIVLSRDEFNEAYAPNSSLMSLLVPTLTDDAIVFVGCSLREPLMPRVFDICMEQRRRREKLEMERGRTAAPPPRFILRAKPHPVVAGGIEVTAKMNSVEELMVREEAYYKKLGITTVWYDAPGGNHSALRRALENLGGLPDITPNHGWEGGSSVS
jgi:hypothetical protein